jgi:YgiT-type zinc finger domain-containing protein
MSDYREKGQSERQDRFLGLPDRCADKGRRNGYNYSGVPTRPRSLDRFRKEKEMKCVICRSSDIQKKMIEEEIKSGMDIVLVPLNVLVCMNCGERYYDRNTMRKIEDVRSRLKQKDLEVEEVGKVLRAV